MGDWCIECRPWRSSDIPDFSDFFNSSEDVGVELLQNPGFEIAGSPFGSWTAHAGNGQVLDQTLSSILIHGGDHSCQLVSGASMDTWVEQDVAVEPGRVYSLEFWMRSANASSAPKVGRFAIYDNTNAAYIVTISQPTLADPTVYEHYLALFPSPVGCTSVKIMLIGPAVNTGYCYFDDVSVALYD